MTLYIIGLGLNDEKDISLKGLEAVQSCQRIYLENYTSILQVKKEKLEKLYKKQITLADRGLVEKQAEEKLLKPALEENVALLVIGTPLSATTHIDLLQRAKEMKVETKVIHNTSIFTAIAETGLQLYKFGKTASLPFFEEFYEVKTPLNILKENQKIKAHTLFLLDLEPDNDRFMTVNDALEVLLKINKKENLFTEDTLCIGCARLGSKNPTIKAGSAKELMGFDFGKPPHCLIVPSELHFIEEETIEDLK